MPREWQRDSQAEGQALGDLPHVGGFIAARVRGQIGTITSVVNALARAVEALPMLRGARRFSGKDEAIAADWRPT